MSSLGLMAGQSVLNAGSSMINFGLNEWSANNAAERNYQYWQLMNEYNTPANQMKRFGDAGLNPNLIYGQGTPGNASSPVQRSTQRHDLSIDPNILGALGYQLDKNRTENDIEVSQGTLANQTRSIDAMNALRATQVAQLNSVVELNQQKVISEVFKQANLEAKTARSKFDYDLAQSLRRNTIETAQARLDNIRATIDNQRSSILARTFQNALNLQRSITESFRQTNLFQDSRLKETQIDYNNAALPHIIEFGPNPSPLGKTLKDIFSFRGNMYKNNSPGKQYYH